MKIGIIREEKTPADNRVPVTPELARKIINDYSYVEIKVMSSPNRCYSDDEYINEGIQVVNDVSDCDILLGVKEVPIPLLIRDKTYFFFSHTIKKQVYNRNLLRALVENNIRMIDYEVITRRDGQRVIAFGRFAGMVGAHNAIYTYQKRHGIDKLKRMHQYQDYNAAKKHYSALDLDSNRIVLTGTGRVGNGAAEVLLNMGYKQVSPEDYLKNTTEMGVFTQLECDDYVARKSDNGFEREEFFQNPALYKSIFQAYTFCSNVFINGIYWDNAAPVFFSQEDMTKKDFKIEVIADVTCDIAPVSSVPSTLRPSTIADPIYGYDPVTNKEVPAHSSSGIDVMAIDNLPNELPRDASQSFAEQFFNEVMPELDDIKNSQMLANATVCQRKDLGVSFEYLRDYLNGVDS